VSRNTRLRILDNIERIEAAKTAESIVDEFEVEDRDISVPFDAILYSLLVIGEAVKALPPEVKGRRTDIPWSAIGGLRDILAHEYFDVNREVIHQTLDEPLDQLLSACRDLLDSVPDER
jgi:uncharacterized protein with HEPN domain